MSYIQPDLFYEYEDKLDDKHEELFKAIDITCANTANPTITFHPNYTSISYGPSSSTGPNSYGNYGAVGATGAGGSGGYFNPLWGDYVYNQNPSVDIKGDAKIEGDLKVKGKSLSEFIEKVEQRLAILKPNSELEEKWEELKELGNKYRELEKEILEKEEVWKILKKGDVKINE